MIVGLDKFVEYFEEYQSEYIVIGGLACDLLLNKELLKFRVTKDIDLVITVMEQGSDFISRFKKFVKDGNYDPYKKKDDKIVFHRFINKSENDFPKIIELFSASNIDELKIQHVKPLSGDVTSMSAILLNEEYVDLLTNNTIIINKIRISNSIMTIILKIKAWKDLTILKNEGININSDDITKHKNDIFRLWQILIEKDEIKVSKTIINELNDIIDLLRKEEIDLKQLKIDGSKDKILDNIKSKIQLKKVEETY